MSYCLDMLLPYMIGKIREFMWFMRVFHRIALLILQCGPMMSKSTFDYITQYRCSTPSYTDISLPPGLPCALCASSLLDVIESPLIEWNHRVLNLLDVSCRVSVSIGRIRPIKDDMMLKGDILRKIWVSNSNIGCSGARLFLALLFRKVRPVDARSMVHFEPGIARVSYASLFESSSQKSVRSERFCKRWRS